MQELSIGNYKTLLGDIKGLINEEICMFMERLIPLQLTRPSGHYITKEWLRKENGIEKCAAALETLLYLQKHIVPKIQNKKYFSLKLKNKRLL